MPRFVVLEHDWPATHWDLLLEAGPVLRAWRLLAEPGPGRDVPAEPNFDHRLAYLEYEGPLTGNRGSVRKWDSGTFEWVGDTVRLHGDRLDGVGEWQAAGDGWVFRLGRDFGLVAPASGR